MMYVSIIKNCNSRSCCYSTKGVKERLNKIGITDFNIQGYIMEFEVENLTQLRQVQSILKTYAGKRVAMQVNDIPYLTS
jgi:hypothetical protein